MHVINTVKNLSIDPAPDEAVVTHDHLRIVTNPAVRAGVEEDQLPPRVGVTRLETLTLSKLSSREAVQMAILKIIYVWVSQLISDTETLQQIMLELAIEVHITKNQNSAKISIKTIS